MVKKKKSSAPSDLQSAIDSYGWGSSAVHLPEVNMWIVCVAPQQLKANPKNWRIHTQRQRSTFSSFKDKYGWLGMVMFNLRTGKLIDGHMRVDEAIKNKEPYVPVNLVYLEETEEDEVLATFDNIGLMAQRNNEALQQLIKATSSETVSRAKTQNEQKLQQLKNDLANLVQAEAPTVMLPQSKTRVKVKEPEPEEDEQDEPPEASDEFKSTRPGGAIVTGIDKNVIFDGTTIFGIPSFLPEKLCTPDIAPVATFFGKESSKKHYFCYSSSIYDEYDVGTIGFYIDDYKFDAVYNYPDEFIEWALEIDPAALITPDFSSYASWPLAKNAWALYRSRWVGRLWQEAGFTIIPTVQVLDKSLRHSIDYSLASLPKDCPTVAIECRNNGNKDMSFLVEWINTIVDVVHPDCFVLYGGEEKQKLIHGDITKAFKRGKQTVKVDYRFLPQVITEKKRAKKHG